MAAKLDVNYLCPHCRSHLRIWNNIVFSVKSCDADKQGLLLLNPELGNYEFISHYSLEFKEEECLDFFCPVCSANLIAADTDINMARIIMIDKDEKEYDVYFSRIRGKHSTFKVQENDIVERYGKDSSSYVEYFMARFQQKKTKDQKE